MLKTLAQALQSGSVRVVDLSQTLHARTPIIPLPPQYGQSAPFRLDEISNFDERGPAWYWNNISCGEHTGTHFDAPIHWITGKDYPNNTTETIDVQKLVAPACVIDVSAEARDNPDYLLTIERVEQWEAEHGRIAPGSWVLMRTDWSQRDDPAAFLNLRDGAHTPGGHPDLPAFLARGVMWWAGAPKAWHRCRPGPCLHAALSLPLGDARQQPLRAGQPGEPGPAAAHGRDPDHAALEDPARFRAVRAGCWRWSRRSAPVRVFPGSRASENTLARFDFARADLIFTHKIKLNPEFIIMGDKAMNPTRASILTMPDSPSSMSGAWARAATTSSACGPARATCPRPRPIATRRRRHWPRAIPSTRRTAAFPRCARPSPAITNASAACGSMMNASPPPAPA